ncbi:pseudouridine synthase [Mycena crocata]|nr:pseudouridine synthase [Mycena crocata]
MNLPRRNLAKNAFRWSDRVLYIDRGAIVMNKPPGLITQLDPTMTQSGRAPTQNTVPDLKQNLELPDPPFRVHRLDKGTTGCFVLARSKQTARELSTQFQLRTVDKTYLALVRGGSQSFSERSGQIRIPLKYLDGLATLAPEDEIHEQPVKESKTDWELVASSPDQPLSLLRLKLLTGHKHQLRAHLADVLKTPILGDNLHSQSEPTAEIRETLKLPRDRIFLHASQISFFRYRKAGPGRRFKIRMFAPLPPDFVQICVEAGIPLTEHERLGGLFKSETGQEDDYALITNGEIPGVDGYWIPQHKEA